MLHRHGGLRYVNDFGYVVDTGTESERGGSSDSTDTRRFQSTLFDQSPDDGNRVPSNDAQEDPADLLDPEVEQAIRFLGWGDDQATNQSVHDWLDQFALEVEKDFPLRDELEGDGGDNDADFAASNGDDDEYCNAYLRYMERLADAAVAMTPLSHHDFHLIAAELEYMLALEDEFGILLPDQVERKAQLAARLLLDPNSLSNDDLDIPDYPDLDDPSYWE